MSHHFRSREEIIETVFDYANRILSERAERVCSSYDRILVRLIGIFDEDPFVVINYKMWYKICLNGSWSGARADLALMCGATVDDLQPGL